MSERYNELFQKIVLTASSLILSRTDFKTEAEFNHQARCQLDGPVFQYLKEVYGQSLREFWNSYTIPRESDRAIVIVERRCDPNLEFCIQNAVYFARGYSLHIFCSEANFQYVKIICGSQAPNIHFHIQFRTIGTPQQGRKEYNDLLMTAEFWKQFSETYILTIETDTYLVKALPKRIYDYDYVASEWPWDPTSPGGGGLSHRKRDVMIHICETQDPTKHAQDTFAAHGITALGYTHNSTDFFVECNFTGKVCGFHQWWTYFPELLKHDIDIESQLEHYLTLHCE